MIGVCTDIYWVIKCLTFYGTFAHNKKLPCKTFIALVYTELTLRSSCHSIEKGQAELRSYFPYLLPQCTSCLSNSLPGTGILREQTYNYS